MHASHDSMLNLDHFPVPFSTKAKSVSVLPAIFNRSLLYLGQLCDNGCDYIFLDKKYGSVIIDGFTTIICTIDNTTGLWSIDSTPNCTPLSDTYPYYVHMANSVYAQKNKTRLLDLLHRAAFIRTVSSWKKAINSKFLANWIGFTADAVQKFLPDSINTAKGNMKQP